VLFAVALRGIVGLRFLALLMVGGLACFHDYLIAHNMTTHESIRHNTVHATPYSRGGYFSNHLHLLLGPRLPSLLALREPAESPEGDLEAQRAAIPEGHTRGRDEDVSPGAVVDM